MASSIDFKIFKISTSNLHATNQTILAIKASGMSDGRSCLRNTAIGWGVQEAPHRQRAAAEEAVQRPHLTSEQGRIKPWINKVRTRVKNSHPRFQPTNQPTIFKAPANISETDRAAYEPSVVSIGPFHRGLDELENCKWRFLRCLLSRCGNGNDASRILDECLMDLKARDAEVRGCYSDSENLLSIDPCKLAAAMLLDGCFIIYLMLRRQEEVDACVFVTSPHRLETLEESIEHSTPNILRGESIVEMVDKMQESKTKGEGKDEGMLTSKSVLGSGLESESVVDIEIGGTENFDGLLLGTLEGSVAHGTPNLTGESIVEIVDKIEESRTKEQEKKEGMFTGVSEVDFESGSGSESESAVDLEIGGTENFGGLLLGHLWTWNLIVYDLLKLGNQIPFFVIRLIFDKLFKPPSNHPPGNADQLTDLALNLISDIHPNKSVRSRTTRRNKIHHLLHLFHSSIVTHDRPSVATDLARMHGASTTPERIPNATDLAMAGVKFKRKEKFDSFLDVSFKNGILEIPPLQICDYSKSLFRNLIAFEQCYPHTNADITIYANFMDCIIDTGNDARLLYMKGILFNGLSTDDEVASLFNQLCNQIHFDPRKNYLNHLFVEVTEYHGSRWHQWRAGLVRDYFSNPWVIISVIAAVLLLLLTVEQSFFTAFSYFRPP